MTSINFIRGHAIEVLKALKSESIDCVITSPPYWGQRDYGIESYTLWNAKEDCNHEWLLDETPFTKLGRYGNDDSLYKKANQDKPQPGASCNKCGAWYGQLGLEATPERFVDHLIEVFDEIKRVVKKTGNVFVVIDDTYAGSGSWRSGGGLSEKETSWERKWVKNVTISEPPNTRFNRIKRKSLCLVPELFALRMVYDLGYVLRSKIIWAKKVYFYKYGEVCGSAMPEAVKDRLAHTWEYVYHFTKTSSDYYYNLEALKKGRKKALMKTYQLSLDNSVVEEDKIEDLIFKFVNRDSNIGDVVLINHEHSHVAHFATFPTSLVEMLVTLACPDGGYVLDPFMGSGTTAEVCAKMNRNFIGIDIVDKYVKMSKERVAKVLRQRKLNLEVM